MGLPARSDPRLLPTWQAHRQSCPELVEGAFIEAFNSKLRSECLNAHWFLNLQDACEKLEAWRRHYNEERPHSAIGNIPPIMLANSAGETSPPDLSEAENSRPEWSDVG